MEDEVYFLMVSEKGIVPKNCTNSVDKPYGLPLHKSNSKQLWPILAHVMNTDYVYAVALYCGTEKPEASSFICDAPARAFICCIKGHSGYFSCGKCEVKGQRVQNRTVFLKTDIILRTNLSFRNQTQRQHHHGNSPLESLNIDMVNDFPFEYMHLICLGATKKILKLWTDKKLSRHRLRSKEIIRISDHLEYTKKFVTNDFARKPRTLGELDRWKATELRTFLLYTGPIVLKNNISDKYYRNFMLLSVATRLLAEPCQSKENINYAEQLLEYFVHNFMEIYGKENVSYNIHGLIHIANDVRLHDHLLNLYPNYIADWPRENVESLKQMSTRQMQSSRRSLRAN
ncbi:hypothetical protein Fcan01_19500 [Folsomia candida]|uniref:DUF4218 domain-containing protein n=1 Tax=Folsomia candida TaxID=158441 RepID=A0A226DJR8_FOLCA|nr:hypothetical protein Fcan01_19500 [Folsomia candida]